MGIKDPDFKGIHSEEHEIIGAAKALIMSLMESTGIRSLIDSLFPDDDENELSTGMAVKYLIGNALCTDLTPFFLIEHHYGGAPCDLLFGAKAEDLTADNIGRCLDRLSCADPASVISKASDLCRRKYGFTAGALEAINVEWKLRETSEETEQKLFLQLSLFPECIPNVRRYPMRILVDQNLIVTHPEERTDRTRQRSDGIQISLDYGKYALGTDKTLLQTPEREKAMTTVMTLLAVLTSTADAVFRRSDISLRGKPLTIDELSYELMNTFVCLDRDKMSVDVMTPKDHISLFRILDILDVDPQLLLGYAV